MADNVNICCERVYQHNETKNRESDVRSPQNLNKFRLIIIFLYIPRTLFSSEIIYRHALWISLHAPLVVLSASHRHCHHGN